MTATTGRAPEHFAAGQPAFAGAALDRAAHLRCDPVWLAEALEDPDTRFVPFCAERALITSLAAPRVRFVAGGELSARGIDVHGTIAVFLGLYDGRALFALETHDRAAVLPGELAELRQVGLNLPPAEAGILAYALAMLGWRRRYRYSPSSGEVMAAESGGHVLVSPQGERHFPRVDPAVIVLVSAGERCLLGRRGAWTPRRYSTIAGYIEPGESPEDALAREVREETNIEVTEAWYFASQPWPFPASLMLGFRARAAGGEVRCNDGELAAAGWFTRGDIAAGRILLPSRLAISYRLIESWFNEYDGPPLAEIVSRETRRE